MSASKYHLYHRLQLAAHTLKKAADRAVLDAANLTTAQASVLSIVKGASQMSQRQIADQLALNESAVTAMVNRLLKLGFLERRRSEKDARAWMVSLSKNGLEALEDMREPFGEINSKLEEILPEKDMAELAVYLNSITKAFSKD